MLKIEKMRGHDKTRLTNTQLKVGSRKSSKSPSPSEEIDNGQDARFRGNGVVNIQEGL